MSTFFSINFNKIALLRNSRGRDYPSVAEFARQGLALGINGLTLHPRPDQRHARYSDVYELKQVAAEFSGAELNIEGYPCDEFMQVVLDAKPHQCTLVPDDPNQITSDHGWNLHQDFDLVKSVVAKLKAAGIRSSIFMDPVAADMELAKATGADRIELYTESYAQAFATEQQDAVLAQFSEATKAAQALGLEVNAGHDLSLENLDLFLTIPDIKEVSIGHALVVESLQQGYERTVKAYVDICKSSA
ncbi:pyridoxine 5'-phosphate synthase [Motilimonas cestriensis]|uniref:Pyridoxine 5'-phosphate synthase n=1 Tax=Motilimonas cestriensis TaxID=2742685 RepID=A0ABS8WDJ4_9GAMM|nr:pyridoxine 5'-phosphate synthase [Motilimonas cestriensis]MCE2596560.1 pyridoxine 5'-phosphate synthase [Motilimonas cestriensis]